MSDLSLRLLTYNVKSLRLGASEVPRVIAACEPDVVCIQEAPRFFRWRSKCARLARESGLFVVTGGRPAAAMLLLARVGVDVHQTRDVQLTKTPDLHQRGLAMAVLSLRGAKFGVASMHLGLQSDERIRHVPEVLRHLEILGNVPLILAGDVNEEPPEPAFSALATRFVDAYAKAPQGPPETFSARNPTRRIDVVFVDPRVEVVSCGVPQVPHLQEASDHLPLLAVLRIPQSN